MITYIIVFVIAIVLIVVSSTKTEHFDDTKKIPKVIWTYWHDLKKMPRVVLECIRSWQRHCPDHDIRVLGPKDVERFVPESRDILRALSAKKLSHAHVSDYVRLAVLKDYGGVWMDASVYLTASLDWLRSRSKGKDLAGFYHWSTHKDHKHPIIENFFLMAPEGSMFIADWHDELLRARMQYDSEDHYIEDAKKTTDIQDLGSKLPYLIVYLCAAVVQQRGANAPYALELMDAMGPLGPYKYMNKYQWDIEKSIGELQSNPDVQTPIIKFHNGVRDFLEERRISIRT